MAVLRCATRAPGQLGPGSEGSSVAVKERGEAVADVRREQMLAAAAELIAERGFSETRIADVATRVGASPALVIYYFGTKDSLLTEALRWSERAFYASVEAMLQETPALRDRIETLVNWCLPRCHGEVPADWGLWFDLWAQAFRHPEVKKDRVGAGPAVARPRHPGGAGRDRRRRDRHRSTWRRSPSCGRHCSTAGRAGRARGPGRRRAAAPAAGARHRHPGARLPAQRCDPARPLASADPRSRRRVGAAGVAKRSTLAHEPVDVLVGVLHRDRPLLALAPRRQEHAAVVLVQPVRVAELVVDVEEVAVVADRVGQEDDAALGAGRDHVPGRSVRSRTSSSPSTIASRSRSRWAYASGVSTSVSMARAAAIVSGLPLNVPTCS